MPRTFPEEEIFVFRKEIKSDSYIVYLREYSVSSDAHIKTDYKQTLDSVSYIKKLDKKTQTTDLFIVGTKDDSLSADSYIEKARTETLTSESDINLIGIPYLITPTNNELVNIMVPPLWFKMKIPYNNLNSTIHIHLQIGTGGVNPENIVHQSYSWNDDWEYWDGAQWVEVPTTGIPIEYAGNTVRYKVLNKLPKSDQEYQWRARSVDP